MGEYPAHALTPLLRSHNPREHMTNIWGYSHLSFFAPMSRYASGGFAQPIYDQGEAETDGSLETDAQ